MRFYYDTEFLENGKTIELISIGIVREDGEEYYAVNADMPENDIHEHRWLMQNVWPSLPIRTVTKMDGEYDEIDLGHPDVKSKSWIKREVTNFLLKDATPFDRPELWAWFAAYDHVALAQLWGPMIHMPHGIPMYTKDIRQLVDHKGISAKSLPQQTAGEHNALEDARHNKVMYDYLSKIPWPRG